jgi:hypothetical protein
MVFMVRDHRRFMKMGESCDSLANHGGYLTFPERCDPAATAAAMNDPTTIAVASHDPTPIAVGWPPL